MAAPIYTAADYSAALAALLPRGRVWPKEADSVQFQVLGSFSPSFARSNGAANDLLVDAFPASTFNLLPEWEETLGLPDPCAGDQPTIAQRRAQVLARFIAGGGQSVAYFIAFAAALGFTITITQFKPFSVVDDVDDSIYGTDWAHAWQVNAPLNTVIFFDVESGVGDALAAWSNAVLECEIKRYAPAQSIVIFAYS